MRIRSFIVAYALVLAILLFADRRPAVSPGARYTRVVDLTDGRAGQAAENEMGTRIVSPAKLIPGTWSADQIPAERLIAALVVMDVKSAEPSGELTLDEIANWEGRHGVVPQGAVVVIRRDGNSGAGSLPINTDAAQFLMDARYVLGFVVDTTVDFSGDRNLSRQLALHGSYVVEGATRFSDLPETGSLIIVAPGKNRNAATAPVRVLAMVR